MPLLPLGKLPGELLQAVLDKHVPRDPRVVVGPRVGEDAAVIDLGDRYLVATADPITFATDDLGWYALQVNANDIVVRGATPRWFLATLLLPARTTDEESVRALFAQLASACEDHFIQLRNTADGRPLARLAGRGAGFAPALGFLPDGRRLVSAARGQLGVVAVWDTAAGNPVTQWSAPDSAWLAAAVSADGKLVARGGRQAGRAADKTENPGLVRLRDAVSGADRVVSHPRNRGLVAAFKAGVSEAVRAGADVVVNLDADGQHDPAHIASLVLPIVHKERVSHLLYLDNGHKQHAPSDIGEMLILSQRVGQTVEALLERKRQAARG